jgi:hypothetical protein
MNRKNIILSLLLLAAIPMAAQKLIIKKTTIDVGKTGFQQPVTAVFECHNKSRHKLRIQTIEPDCYCTIVDYPKGDIGGNEKFQIKMTYDAQQLGHFDKQAAVITNGTQKPLYLCMKGVVLTEVQDFSTTYPLAMGNLLLDKNELEFDDINRGSVQEQQIHLYNNGSKAYYPNLMHLPPYLTATMTPKRLAPRQAGTLKVALNSAQIPDYGLTQATVYLAQNPGDKVSPDNEIPVSVILLPSFTGMSESAGQYAPKIQLSKEKVVFRFDGKKKKSDVIEISNGGRTELDISSMQLFTDGLKVSLGKSRLAPGAKTKLKITALRDELKNTRTRPRILMITNDPKKPKVTIEVKYEP